MTNGVLLFAHNNQKMDYVKQAIYCARKIKKYLNLPVALVTDSKGYLQKRYQQHACLFEYIIENKTSSNQTRKFRNGYSTAVLPWNNFSRCESYDITPFKNTLVLDTDFLLGVDVINKFNMCIDFPNRIILMPNANNVQFIEKPVSIKI